MLVRNCAGGIVFAGGKALLLRNERSEWVLPKGPIPEGALSADSALAHVLEQTGVRAQVVGTVGETSYEFYSTSRKTPVNNRILWYLMRSPDDSLRLNESMGIVDGGYFDRYTALSLITYSQDRGLLVRAWEQAGERADSP
ncbi:MAG: NUDIX domain-containing protein [Clostridiales bacterium]|nr:NUDIX domain-containing protein [Clostridiales bacterium]